jgi:hypothetical protein
MNTESAEVSEASNIVTPGKRQRRKILLIALFAVLLGGAIGGLFWVISPETAPLWGMLPPGADLYIYADMQGLQSNPAVKWYLSDGPGLPLANGDNKDPENETQRFVDATGFQYQNDLRQLAAARKGDYWIGAARVSVDRQRFEDYLRSRATNTTEIATTTVYTYGSTRPLKVGLVRDDLLVFSVGVGEDGLAQAMLLLATPLERHAALANVSQGLNSDAAANLQALTSRQLWLVGTGKKLLGSAQDAEGPSLGGFLLGEETLKGIETILASVESSTLTLNIEGHLLTRPGTDPKPVADNLSLLASLMRPRAPEAGGRDLRPLWDAIKISPQKSSVLIRWQQTTQMLSLMTKAN